MGRLAVADGPRLPSAARGAAIEWAGFAPGGEQADPAVAWLERPLLRRPRNRAIERRGEGRAPPRGHDALGGGCLGQRLQPTPPDGVSSRASSSQQGSCRCRALGQQPPPVSPAGAGWEIRWTRGVDGIWRIMLKAGADARLGLGGADRRHTDQAKRTRQPRGGVGSAQTSPGWSRVAPRVTWHASPDPGGGPACFT